jgi:hypothetical protein
MVRKATLTNKAVLELRLKIDCALQPEGRRRIGSSAVEFRNSIRQQIAAPKARLSKKQRDTTDEILAEAFSDEPVVILEGQPLVDLAKLIRHASGDDVRVSSLEENVMVHLKRRLDELATADSSEPALAISPKQWQILKDIEQKTNFGYPEESPSIDPDGVVENDDQGGQPPERGATEGDHARDWAVVGVDEDEDC